MTKQTRVLRQQSRVNMLIVTSYTAITLGLRTLHLRMVCARIRRQRLFRLVATVYLPALWALRLDCFASCLAAIVRGAIKWSL